jgi:hypothetical protein
MKRVKNDFLYNKALPSNFSFEAEYKGNLLEKFWKSSENLPNEIFHLFFKLKMKKERKFYRKASYFGTKAKVEKM